MCNDAGDQAYEHANATANANARERTPMNATNATTTNDAARRDAAKYERIAREVHRFTTLGHALSFANAPGARLWVMLGDDERYWATTPANCAALERMGYEYAI